MDRTDTLDRPLETERRPRHVAPTRIQSQLGATPIDGHTRFLVWAPRAERVEVEIGDPPLRVEPLEPRDRGYHAGVVEDAPAGTLYRYWLDGTARRPDPASRFQPAGVHGPSCVVDPTFDWSDDDWTGLDLKRAVLYELHVGTFSPEGTFDAIVPRLDALADLGVTAIELMPVAQFAGSRGWGYDGVFPYAVQDSYGGPDALRRLVAECHAHGLAVVLDVVYNRLGSEGNYLADFGPYFVESPISPSSGLAINMDCEGSDEVRRFFNDSAVLWLREYHVDGLRLDGVDQILNRSATHFLEDLGFRAHLAGDQAERRVVVFAGSDDNRPCVVDRLEHGGYGLDALWTDDFHHALHTLLTEERQGYYQDFGPVECLEWALTDGFAYAGQRSEYRGRRHGRSARAVPAWRHVVYAQNHDQVGNRVQGDRLSGIVDFEEHKLAAATVILSPFVPLLFMGEEYGETAPFPYFVSHGDEELVEAARQGRRDALRALGWEGEIPDPADEATFRGAGLDWHHRSSEPGAAMLSWYRALLRLRREVPALAHLSKDHLEAEVSDDESLLTVHRWLDAGAGAELGSLAAASDRPGEVALLLHFGLEPAEHEVGLADGEWKKLVESADVRFGGPGAPCPDVVRSEGGARVTLARRSAVLLARA